MKYGKAAQRPRTIPEPPPAKPSESWWLCKPEDFYREARQRFPEMSATRFGKMRLTTDEAATWR